MKTFNRKWTVFGSNKTVNSPGGTTVSKKSESYNYSTTISGGYNPSYKLQIAAGANAGTGLVVDAQDLQIMPGFCSATVSPGVGIRTDYTFDGLFPFGSVVFVAPSYNSNAEAEAVRRLYSKLRAVHTQALGGVFAGEIKQTVALIMNPLKGIAKLTAAYGTSARRIISAAEKSRRNSGPRALVKARQISGDSLKSKLASEYLKWTFGVVPLMNDISDASKIIQRTISDPHRERFSVRGEVASSTESVLAPVSFGAVRCTVIQRDVSRSKVVYYGAFKAMDNKVVEGVLPRLGKIQELSGFTLRDFIPTVWNLIPYSFIADYFLNIGDVLEALTTDTSGVAWISRTQVVESVRIRNVTPDLGLSKSSNPPYYVWSAFSGSLGGYVATRRTINRATATIPIMELRSKIQNNTGKHVANLVALIAARLK